MVCYFRNQRRKGTSHLDYKLLIFGYLSVGILHQCLAGNFLETCKETVALKAIKFTFLNMEICTTAQTLLT